MRKITRKSENLYPHSKLEVILGFSRHFHFLNWSRKLQMKQYYQTTPKIKASSAAQRFNCNTSATQKLKLRQIDPTQLLSKWN